MSAIESVRERQIRNFLLTLAISRGVPMLLAGDEFRRTQRGNNNAYRQDNGTRWVDWSFGERHQDLVRFTRQAFAFRRAHAVLRREAFYNNRDIEWFDPGGCSPDWLDHSQKRLACLVRGEEGSDLYMMFNADVDPASFVLPALPPLRRWRVAADTSRSSAEDFDTEQRHTDIPPGACWIAGPRSCAILVACPSPSSTAEATLPGGTHARTASVR